MTRDHLDRAEELISSGEESSLRYAALEIRLAVENHVYKKLSFYAERHGEKLLFERWQPNKALKTLCQLEPSADQSYTFRFAKEGKDGQPNGEFKTLGRHESLSASWVSKHYHKLGSLLHLEAKYQKFPVIDKTYLEEVAEELRRVQAADFMCNIAEVVSIVCQKCDSKIVCCTSALPGIDEVICPNPNCNASYTPVAVEDNWEFTLNKIDFTCPGCGDVKSLLRNEVTVGLSVTCKKCDTHYEIIGNQWLFSKVGR